MDAHICRAGGGPLRFQKTCPWFRPPNTPSAFRGDLDGRTSLSEWSRKNRRSVVALVAQRKVEAYRLPLVRDRKQAVLMCGEFDVGIHSLHRKVCCRCFAFGERQDLYRSTIEVGGHIAFFVHLVEWSAFGRDRSMFIIMIQRNQTRIAHGFFAGGINRQSLMIALNDFCGKVQMVMKRVETKEVCGRARREHVGAVCAHLFDESRRNSNLGSV